MRHDEAARIVLVRAVEEVLPDRIAPEALLEAHLAAGDPTARERWFARRADYLVAHVLGGYRGLLAPSDMPLPAPWLWIGLAVVVGLASNYLGPAGRIHVILNPIVVLIAWNLAVYAGLAAHALAHRGARDVAVSPPPDRVTATAATSPGGAPFRPRLLERLVLGRVFAWLIGTRAKIDDGLEDVRATARVARRFAVLWWPVVRPAAVAWLRRLLHLAAIGVAVGAVLGTYLRGLFFAYRVVWRSTFVGDPEIVGGLLGLLFGPAALILGQAVPGALDVPGLASEAGDPAGRWIHLYAVTVVLAIVIPRAVLAAFATRALRRRTDQVALALDDEYHRDLVERALAVSPAKLEASVRTAVEDECRRFAVDLADLVCRELYDETLAPRLRAFRETGGTLRDLEDDLRRRCESFRPTLAERIPMAQQQLERALVIRVRRLLGDETPPAARPSADLTDDVGVASSSVAVHLGSKVGGDLAAMVGGVVSTSVGVAAATLTVAVEEVIGVAVLVGLAETGPIGWVIAALGGAVATGALLWLGREALRDGIKTVHLPARVVKMATLSAARYERIIADGRAKCDVAVRDALAGRMRELAGSIADHVWERLKPLVGELQRPRIRPVDVG